MNLRKVMVSAWVGLALMLMVSSVSGAGVVGRLTQVEGRVDILKGGQLPATPVKVDDEVQTGDVLRTKSLSKAQITFIDNSTLTVAPESRVGIEAYMFDPAQQKRNAVVQLFQGLAHVVVNQVFKTKEPDFVVKTQTAIMGVRGTEFGIRLQPNSSDILNFTGQLQVGNIFPEVGALDRRAFKRAYAFGPGGGGSHHWVFLTEMQGTTVSQGLPPTQPYELTAQDREWFMKQLIALVPGAAKLYHEQKLQHGANQGPQGLNTQLLANVLWDLNTLDTLNTLTVPPVVVSLFQTSPSGSTSSTNFSQVYTGPYQLVSTQPFTVATFSNTGPGIGVRTGVYPGAFTADYSFTAVWVDSGMVWNPSYQGTFRATMSGLAKAPQNQTLSTVSPNVTQAAAVTPSVTPLTGTMKAVFTDPNAGRLVFKGPVTLYPDGGLTANLTGTGVTLPSLKKIKVTGGTLTQTPVTNGTITNQTVAPTGTVASTSTKPSATK